jgi:hypothetical protein
MHHHYNGSNIGMLATEYDDIPYANEAVHPIDDVERTWSSDWEKYNALEEENRENEIARIVRGPRVQCRAV